VADPLSLTALRASLGALARVSPAASARLAARLFCTPRPHPIGEEEQRLLTSGTALTLRSGLAATSWGEGPAILLVHGWERQGASLGRFVEPLIGNGRRVVALDAPAHGNSPGKQTDGVAYARAILAAEAEFGPLEGVIAHSFGGFATLIALNRGLEVARVVLLASLADIGREVEKFVHLIGMPHRAAERFIGLLERQLGTPLEALDAHLLCKQLRQPALLFHDPEDKRVPYEDSLTIAESWPGARLVTVRGLGHSRILCDEGVIAQGAAFICGGVS